MACVEEYPFADYQAGPRSGCRQKIIDDIASHIPVALLATNLGQRPLNGRRVAP